MFFGEVADCRFGTGIKVLSSELTITFVAAVV